MIKYNSILVFLICYFKLVIGEECDNVCYKGVDEELELLSLLYNKPLSVSNIPSTLDIINSLINKTEIIILNTKSAEDVKNKSQTTFDDISHNSKKLALLKNVVDEINLLNLKLDELKRKRDTRNNALNECEEANKMYKTLRDDVENIKQIGKGASTPLPDVSQRIDEIKQQSLDNRNNLYALRITEPLFQTYVCNSKLYSTVQDIINSMGEIAKMLQNLFKGVVKSKLKEIEGNSSKNEQNIKSIGNSLNQETPTTDVKITKETTPNLDNLKRQITDLKNKIKQINLDRSYEDLVENVGKQLKALINEYEVILNHIFSKQNMEKVKEEIEVAKKTLRLLEEKDAVKTELESVKQVVDLLKDRQICFIREKVSVEDKIVQV